jgi:hypothetical protein
MLSQIILALPLLASVAAGSQHGPRHAKHARHAENATRSNTAPVPIFNNALLQSRAQLSSSQKFARRDQDQDEFVREKTNKDGKRVRVMRRKVQACKASNGSTSIIGHEALAASASATAAPSPSASGSDDGAEQAWASAVSSISSVWSASGSPSDWAGPSATTLGASASASASAVSSYAPSVTASPSAPSQAAPSASASSGSGNNMLFPVGRGIASWSTEDGMSRKSVSFESSDMR